MSRRPLCVLLGVLALALLAVPAAIAQSQQQFDEDATRYMALGDSIAAGYKAMPVTEGYTYRLYLGGVFDRIPHTLFNNAAVVGATSEDVLRYQVPQAVIPPALGGFGAGYVTLTVGGNDLLKVLAFAQTGAPPDAVQAYAMQVLSQFAQNIAGILAGLRGGLPAAKIFVANQYPLPEIEALLPYAVDVIAAFNGSIAQVVAGAGPNVYVVDVHTAFLGRNNLVEGARPNVSIVETHPTNAGHRVIAKAFADVIALYR